MLMLFMSFTTLHSLDLDDEIADFAYMDMEGGDEEGNAEGDKTKEEGKKFAPL